MATHSSVLAWRILGMGEPDGLPSMGLHRVGHDWSDLAAAASLIHDRYYTDFLVVLLNNIVRSTYLWNHMETLGWFGMKDIDLVCIMKYGWMWRKKKQKTKRSFCCFHDLHVWHFQVQILAASSFSPGKLDLKSWSLLQNLMVGLNNLNNVLGNKALFLTGEKYTAY